MRRFCAILWQTMKFWRLVLAAILAALLGLAVEAVRLDEPCFQGRSITQWLDSQPYPGHRNPFLHDGMGAPRFLPDAETAQAMHIIGTNAVSTLIRMVSSKDSCLKTRVNLLLDRQTLITSRFRPAYERRSIGVRGFKILGESAKSAAPILPLLTTDSDPGVRYAALESLRVVSADREMLVPVLLRACHDSAPEIRFVATVDLHFRSPQALHNAGIVDPLDAIFKSATNNTQALAPGTQ